MGALCASGVVVHKFKKCGTLCPMQNISLLFGTCDLLDCLGSNLSKFKRVPKNHTSLLHATWSLLLQVRFSCSS